MRSPLWTLTLTQLPVQALLPKIRDDRPCPFQDSSLNALPTVTGGKTDKER